MKHAIIPHREEALKTFETFIRNLQAHLLEYYYSGTWINEPRGSFTIQAFVLGMVDRILLHLAKEYYSADHFNKQSASFVLVTARPAGAELIQLPYLLDEDLLGGMSKFHGRFLAPFERLLYLYGLSPAAILYASVTTSIDNLISLVLGDVFVRMERGELTNEDPTKMPVCPPTRLCVAKRVQDVTIDSRLVIGADVVWIPVVPEGKFMRGIMDVILGYEESELPEKSVLKVEYEDLSPLDLSDQQELAARQLAVGPIHSVFREKGELFVIMADDMAHPYVWYVEGAGIGSWKHARERMVYPKLMGSGVKVYKF